MTLRKSELREGVISFFEQEGKILTESEWGKADKEGRSPFNVKLIGKHFISYKRFLKMLQAQEHVRLGAIGSKPVEPEIHEEIHEEVPEQPAEEEPTPLDKLRALSGESSE